MSEGRTIRRALLAVYDKTGVVELARALRQLDVELVSSGGTAAALREAGLEVTPVEDVTGSPEMLGGRVKTLHPKIHAGILADRRRQEHLDQLAEHGIEAFDLVVVNLYPFRETVAGGAGFDDVIEKIDIGGPAMVRAAAKNFESVGVVVNPGRYEMIVDEITLEGGLARSTRFALAAEAFAHTAAYDAAVAGWFAGREDDDALPPFVGLALEKVDDLRYGENPHQRGALYAEAAGAGPLGGAEVLQGKAMSFNNWLDAEAALSLAAALPAARRRHREAQQPVRRGRRGVARGGVPQRIRVRHGVRVRRDRRVPRRGRRRRRRGHARGLHRGGGRARVHATGPRRLRRARQPPRRAGAAPRRRRSMCGRCRRRARAGPRPVTETRAECRW